MDIKYIRVADIRYEDMQLIYSYCLFVANSKVITDNLVRQKLIEDIKNWPADVSVFSIVDINKPLTVYYIKDQSDFYIVQNLRWD